MNIISNLFKKSKKRDPIYCKIGDIDILLPDSYDSKEKFIEDFTKFRDKDYLLEEYKKLNKDPVYHKFGDINILIPAAYDNKNDFIDDFLAFQDKEYLKYERHNKRHPDNQISEKEIIVDSNIRLIAPLRMVKNGMTDTDIVIECLHHAFERYNDAIQKTIRLNKESPKKARNVSLNKKHLDYCTLKHIGHIAETSAIRAGKGLKWSTEQLVNTTIGTLASPLALAYKILDKKHRISISPTKKKWIDEKSLPYVVRGAKKGLAILSAYTLLMTGSFAKEKHQQLQKEKAHKERFFDKYNTTNEVFYQNYKIAKENEAMIVALIACQEGFKSDAYLCQAKKPTDGYGTTRTIKKDKDGNIEYDEKGFAITIPVVLGTTTTKEDGFEDVVAHLEKYVYPQLEHINKILESQEIAAVCMFIYNTDEGAFKDSMLCVAINNDASDEKIREAFSIIRSVGGIRSYGLINRHGFEGYVFCCENIEELINIKPTIAGSPDIKYYQYGKSKRNPLENDDKTFVVRDIEEVMKDAEKFKTDDYKKCIVFMLPQEKAKEVLEKYGFHVDEQGKLKKDITWEEAQEILSKSTEKQEKKNKKQSVKQSKLTYKINKNTGRK